MSVHNITVECPYCGDGINVQVHREIVKAEIAR